MKPLTIHTMIGTLPAVVMPTNAPALPATGNVAAGSMYQSGGVTWWVVQGFNRTTYGADPSTYPALIRMMRDPAVIAGVQTTRLVLRRGGQEDSKIYGKHPNALRLWAWHIVGLAGAVAVYVYHPEQVPALWIANIALIGVSIHNYLVWRKQKAAATPKA